MSRTNETRDQDFYKLRQVGSTRWGKVDWAALEKDFEANGVTIDGRNPGLLKGS